MNESCGCCEGAEPLTPISTANRPGLDALVYRVGTHATFLETMKARLSSSDFPSLANLKTRDASDPALAFLDAWATVADVLTFYQERIANEGYLRTATERRSILELARLVGYTLRPGVAATVYPAFTMETGSNQGSQVPAGTRIQSLPGPGEMPQFFETAETIEARADWNNLQPRLTQPHYITREKANTLDTLYFQGISTNLKPNDPLLLVFEGQQVFRQVQAIEPQAMENRTRVKLQVSQTQENSNLGKDRLNQEAGSRSEDQVSQPYPQKKCPIEKLGSVVDGLLKPPSIPPANALRLELTPKDIYKCESDIAPQLLATLKPTLATPLYTAWANTEVTAPSELQSTQALRVKAAPFGANAPPKPVYDDRGRLRGSEEWAIAGTMNLSVSLFFTPTSSVESRSRVGFANYSINLVRSVLSLISITQDNTMVSSQVALSEQNPNLDVSLGQNTVRVAILTTNLTCIRFIHALPEVDAVDVYIDDSKVLTGISRFETSDYLVITGTQNQSIGVQVKLTGQQVPLLNKTLTLPASNLYRYSILATGVAGTQSSQQVDLTILQDDLSDLTSGQARVRIVHASPDTSAVTVTLSSMSTPLATSLSFRSPSNYSSINIGDYDLTVTSANNQNLIPSRKIKFESETVYDIFLVGLFNSQPRLDIKIFEPSLLPGEQTRIVFKFLELNREYRFIVNRAGVIAQVANGKLLTSRFIPNQRLQYSSDGRTVTIESSSTNGTSNLTLSEQAPNSVPQALRNILALDAQYDQVLPHSWVVVERPDSSNPERRERLICKVLDTQTLIKADYGISAKITQLTLDRPWLEEADRLLTVLRQTTVYAQSEELQLAEEVIDPKQYVEGKEIELGDLYDGLQPGRWLIVSGERVDLGDKTTGVKASELVMLTGVKQNVKQFQLSQDKTIELPGDKAHSFLQLANPLAYQYKRDTVTIYGNVVKATHGETRAEVLGSGDGSKPFQQFPLRQPPLTYLAAPTPIGTQSTLEVRVNELLWHETDSLVGLNPTDRQYITRMDDEGKTTVIFGNGQNGARLPSGVENVKAVYRNGIGKVGNVKAEQISLLATRPLGVKSVINPLPATGGADRESRDQARRNAPLAVMSLDRLVSVQDYADFARTFAGIGKASAARLSDGRRQLVHLTIAGTNDIPIDKSSDLYRNLVQALYQYGDPYQPIRVEMRELMVLIIVANVRILPDYQWESVAPQIRTALLDTFSFERRELGQSVLLSEVISTIQKVPGVAYADIDVLDSVSESEAKDPTQLAQKLEQLANPETGKPKRPKDYIPVNLAQLNKTDPAQPIQPAQLAVLSPELADTLLLKVL